MEKQPIYNANFDEDLQKAIDRGLIVCKQDPDGVMRYAMTREGLIHWQIEALRKNGMFG